MDSAVKPSRAFALFDYGFRPFFLFAIWQALLVVPAWLWIWNTGSTPLGPLPASIWHAHEMIFGFVPAAIAGFLLTAVPSWTGSRGYAGAPLVVLSLAWLGGRIAFAASLPGWPLALLELSFLPALAYLIGRTLFRERNRNRPLLLVLAALWIADALVVTGVLRADVALAQRSLLAGLDIVLVLVTVIAGRIVPAFTGNALRASGTAAPIRSSMVVERSVLAVMVLNVIADALGAGRPVTAVVAAAAALAHAARLARWQGRRTLGLPIVWILHVAYAWLVVGFALKAIALGFGAGWAAYWMHALGIGAAATMIVAVVTRATLGHTGRPLVTPGPAVAGYLFIVAAGLARVFVPAFADYTRSIFAAGICWSVAFALIAWSYTPMLVRPRLDGRAG